MYMLLLFFCPGLNPGSWSCWATVICFCAWIQWSMALRGESSSYSTSTVDFLPKKKATKHFFKGK